MDHEQKIALYVLLFVAAIWIIHYISNGNL